MCADQALGINRNMKICLEIPAPLEWSRSVRAICETQVAAYYEPGSNITQWVAYRSPITFRQFLLSESVCYFDLALWCCTQLPLDVGNGSLCMCLPPNFNALGGVVTFSPHVPSTCTLNGILSVWIRDIIPSSQQYVAIDNPSLIQSICCFSTTSLVMYYCHADDNDCNSEIMQSPSEQCVPHWDNIRDQIEVILPFKYCLKCQH
jgi:hypothetical protein